MRYTHAFALHSDAPYIQYRIHKIHPTHLAIKSTGEACTPAPNDSWAFLPASTYTNAPGGTRYTPEASDHAAAK